MDTQFTVTYKIDNPFSDERFYVLERYQAEHYYNDGCIVTEIHETVTLLPPHSKALYRVMTDWHDKDHENFDYEPEEL